MLGGQHIARFAQRIAQLHRVVIGQAQIEHLVAPFVDQRLGGVERRVDLLLHRRVVRQGTLDQVEAQDQRLHALQKSIVQRAGNALALEQRFARALGNARRQLRQAGQVSQVQHAQHGGQAGQLEPQRLRQRRRY